MASRPEKPPSGSLPRHRRSPGRGHRAGCLAAGRPPADPSRTGVATDGEGILPDALDRAARATSARVVVLVPALQNPTGATMGAAHQQAVAEIARQRGLQVIEDDVYGMLAETPPLARLLPETCTVVTSLSKCVAGGLRFGVIAGTSAAVRARWRPNSRPRCGRWRR
ncbi:aminotransferase class I/II-fold pyridoxal phosphate-dependent enzyme [Magnetospirillum molischianum]|uniref:aminotransferase class I/II-fold pyridoxal phosphate-dependent enzyme n=1 Tax=Magnetospirillum molischianum TaxID=1083 RepID=UPI001F486BCD|nr:aminotransferase class I/II-fold pyridoxal phosphate-dependent enzyme [Magnetospirillum molischianum]